MPPYPVFTAIGFFIHSIVFWAIGFRLLKRRTAKIFLLIGIGSILDAINFTIILILFFLFPNTVIKSNIFAVNAGIIVPISMLFFIAALVYYWKPTRRLLWPFIALGVILISYQFSLAWTEIQKTPFEASFVHPAYPKLVANSQAAGIVSSFLFAGFFLYNAIFSTLFIRRRSIILGIGSFLLSVSTLYWVSSTPLVYITTHILGPLGSLFIAAGIFWYAIPDDSEEAHIPQVISS